MNNDITGKIVQITNLNDTITKKNEEIKQIQELASGGDKEKAELIKQAQDKALKVEDEKQKLQVGLVKKDVELNNLKDQITVLGNEHKKLKEDFEKLKKENDDLTTKGNILNEIKNQLTKTIGEVDKKYNLDITDLKTMQKYIEMGMILDDAMKQKDMTTEYKYKGDKHKLHYHLDCRGWKMLETYDGNDIQVNDKEKLVCAKTMTENGLGVDTKNHLKKLTGHNVMKNNIEVLAGLSESNAYHPMASFINFAVYLTNQLEKLYPEKFKLAENEKFQNDDDD